MNQIEIQCLKGIESLDAVSFFHVLVQEGCRSSIISPAQLEALQSQLIELLADQFNRWTGGQSSSVSVETGQQIQQSILYAIGYYLKKLPGAEAAMEEIKRAFLKDLFLMGKKCIEDDRKSAEQLLHHIQENCFVTEVFAYNDTLRDGLPMFFTSYDIDYAAHETPASIDYPLSCDNMNLTGIDYIREYLQKLKMENEFCSYFPIDEILCLMRGYDRQYKDLLFNIFTLVLNNAVGCLLLGREKADLSISEYDRQYLQKELSLLPKEKLSDHLDQTVLRLCSMLSITDPQLEDYIKMAAADLKGRLKGALESDSLRNLFLSAKEEMSESVLYFEDKAKLDQEHFLMLADELRDCRFVSDKLALLKKAQPGFADLLDLLEGECFFEEEYQEVFQSLDEIRLALLIKNLPLDPVSPSFLIEESSKEWQGSLNQYLEQMDPQRKYKIRSLAERII